MEVLLIDELGGHEKEELLVSQGDRRDDVAHQMHAGTTLCGLPREDDEHSSVHVDEKRAERLTRAWYTARNIMEIE